MVDKYILFHWLGPAVQFWIVVVNIENQPDSNLRLTEPMSPLPCTGIATSASHPVGVVLLLSLQVQ